MTVPVPVSPPDGGGATPAQPTIGIGAAGVRGAGNGPWVLECHSLTKQFGTLTAVDNLSFQLKQGEVLGFLGPNGSGKSTTVGMILGLVRPTKGSVSIAGQPVSEHPEVVSEKTGAIIENPAFYPYLSGRDNLKALAIAAGDVPNERIEQLLRLVNMADRADGKYKSFSLGMKQRLGIAATLLTNPALVILDEPTNGLDPAGQREIRSIIPRLAEEGHAVLLASHMLHEVEQVSDRVAIIRKGKLIQEGSVRDLLASGGYIEVAVAPDETETAGRALSAMPWVEDIETVDGRLRVTAPEDAGQAINRALVERGIYASMIAPQRSSLEDLFLELTEEADTAAAAAAAPVELSGDRW
jgi:ABC-2 type transport system ATP-binding protein